MSLSDDLDKDILEFLSKVDNMRFEDRKELLSMIIKKHVLLSNSPIMLTYEDFIRATGMAKTSYVDTAFPIYVRDLKNNPRELKLDENANFCLFESVISVLNNKEAFKKLPSFKKGRSNG